MNKKNTEVQEFRSSGVQESFQKLDAIRLVPDKALTKSPFEALWLVLCLHLN
jgi:hypothetical protein